MRIFPSLLLAGLLVSFVRESLYADDKVIVHEWGTFTCLQDELGKAIGGINVDDEPVPSFVFSVATSVAPHYSGGKMSAHNLGLPPYGEGKGWVSGDPHVTMRLETPVIYIYPPKDLAPPLVPPLAVRVEFHGGVLSQFYPSADFSGLPLRQYPQQPEMSNRFPYVDATLGITNLTTTALNWKNVQIGSTEKPIETDDTVWTAPREVSAPVLQVEGSEKDWKDPQKVNHFTQAEHFLFYRGVGHLDSPVFVQSRLPMLNGKLSLVGWLTANGHSYQNPEPIQRLDGGWIVQIRADRKCAFRSWGGGGIGVISLGCGAYMPSLEGTFSTSDFTQGNVEGLRVSMKAALEKEGLFPDEAAAMLKTWELSYFKSPGLRFFYIMPRAWVDEVLPLKISGAPVDVTRVMIGRIELVTDEQQNALDHLAAGPCPDLSALKKAAFTAIDKRKLTEDEKQAFYSGEKSLGELGITIPPLVQDYLSLGRFRDALIVHEEKQHPTAALTQFIKDNKLSPSKD
jgi:hypothetical protein